MLTTHLVVHHPALVQHIGISTVEKFHRSVEVAQRPNGVTQSSSCLPSPLPTIRLEWISLHECEHEKNNGCSCQAGSKRKQGIIAQAKQSLVIGNNAAPDMLVRYAAAISGTSYTLRDRFSAPTHQSDPGHPALASKAQNKRLFEGRRKVFHAPLAASASLREVELHKERTESPRLLR